MKLLRTLGLALCLASLFTPLLSKAQSTDPVTGLTLNSTGNVLNLGGGLPWDGTVTGAAGGFSGGNTPAYNPSTGNIIFGYNLATASQSIAINTALANAGTGIQISGYKYSWQINNDLYNGGGNRGTLYGNVSLTGPTGLLLESFNYNYNMNLPSFTTFSGTQFFNNRYDPSATGNLTVSFTGKDQNWWAGYYGPRVHVDNVSLLYTAKPVVVDPCSIDPLSSPICPGYALATIKNSILGTTVSNASAPIVTYAPGPAEAGPTPIPVEITAMLGPAQQQLAGPIQQQVMQQQGPMMGPMAEQQPPPPQQTQGGPQPGPANQNPGPAVMASSAPAPTTNNAQPKIGEASDSGGGSKSTSTVSLSSVLSMIGSNQDKTSALEKSVVQAADAQAFSAGETAKQQAEKVAGDVQSQSISTSGSSQTTTSQSSVIQSSSMQMQSSSLSMQGNSQSNSASNSARLQQSINISSTSNQTETTTFNGTSYQQNNFQNNTRQDFNVSMVTPSVSYNISAPTRYVPQVQIEMPTLEGIKFGGHKGPVDSAMESKPMLPQMNQGQQQLSSVNRNVQNNDAAGNITIESIAKQPIGYAQYFGIMPDVAFYEPKEIYKNQKTVDNVRALRQLSSDKLHQDMVNQQYK